MRNLSLEAAKLAERDIIAADSRLADPMFRKRLAPVNKQAIFTQLTLWAAIYEEQLIAEIAKKTTLL